MKKLIYLLLLMVSCSKQQITQESKPQAIERAVNSPEITEFYTLALQEARLVRANPIASIEGKVKEITTKQVKLMESIKDKFPEFTEDEMKTIFRGISKKTGLKFVRPMAARGDYPYDTNCRSNWDNENNSCWERFLWAQWWHLLKGLASWGSTIDSVDTFTNCSSGAERNYYYCSGD